METDRQVAGLSDEAPPHYRQRDDRRPIATFRISWTMGSHLLRRDIAEVNDARVELGGSGGAHSPSPQTVRPYSRARRSMSSNGSSSVSRAASAA
jgi:hypothetical protein